MSSSRENLFADSTSTYSPEEAARLFFQHLLDNVGQFQQLYDGLFRWKMNGSPSSLPSFNVIRPHFVNLLLGAGVRSGMGSLTTTAIMGHRDTSTEVPIRTDDSLDDDILDRITEFLNSADDDASQHATPFETASESGNTPGNVTPITADTYARIYEPYLVQNERMPTPDQSGQDEYWEPDNLRSLFENLSPPSCPKDAWLEEPLQDHGSNLDEDFDFEANLAAFEKIPLTGQVAQVASSNARKQDKAIKRLFKRAQRK